MASYFFFGGEGGWESSQKLHRPSGLTQKGFFFLLTRTKNGVTNISYYTEPANLTRIEIQKQIQGEVASLKLASLIQGGNLQTNFRPFRIQQKCTEKLDCFFKLYTDSRHE